MSCHNWETAELILPHAAVVAVRTAVVSAYNQRQTADYTLALRFHASLVAAGKGKRGFSYASALSGLVQAHQTDDDGDGTWTIERTILPRGATKPRLPRLKEFPHLPLRAKSVTVTLGEATIRFAGAVVRWETGENNHQVDRAHSHPIAHVFFAALEQVVWTRGSGGFGVGNDEYRRESQQSGDGGNYETSLRYGPRGGQPAGQSAAQIRRAAINGRYNRY